MHTPLKTLRNTGQETDWSRWIHFGFEMMIAAGLDEVLPFPCPVCYKPAKTKHPNPIQIPSESKSESKPNPIRIQTRPNPTRIQSQLPSSSSSWHSFFWMWFTIQLAIHLGFVFNGRVACKPCMEKFENNILFQK